MERHEIPTHLEVADRAFLGLTIRQLLAAAVGLALAYGAINDLPLPLALRIAVALLVVVITAVLVLWRPGGRAAEEWVFVLLRYWTASRVAVWRPRERDGAPNALREVVLPPAPSRTSGRGTGDAA